MTDLTQRLQPIQRRGSKLRCHCLTHGPDEEVAARLTTLIEPWGQVTALDQWMPEGLGNDDETLFNLAQLDEAQLDKACRLIPNAEIRSKLATWWLAEGQGVRKTPHFDIASTCRIKGKKGFLLVEAKAHHKELDNTTCKSKSQENRERIGTAIESARVGLSRATGLSWGLSRDSHYQVSNRFAWCWKLTELGFPVILVYLGFLNVEEKWEGKGNLFANHSDWEQLVRTHSKPTVPPDVWNQRWMSNGQPFIPLIGSKDQKLPPNAE